MKTEATNFIVGRGLLGKNNSQRESEATLGARDWSGYRFQSSVYGDPQGTAACGFGLQQTPKHPAEREEQPLEPWVGRGI